MTNWEIMNLGDVYDVRDGTHDSPKYVNEGYALVTSKNLKNDNLVFDKVNYISEEDYININKRSRVDIGDVLFAMIGTIGNPVVIKHKPNFAIKNVALFKVPKGQDSYFLKYYLDSEFVIQQMIKDAKGATQKFVGLGYLRKFKIPVPPINEQKQIVSILDKTFAAIDKAKANAEQNLKNVNELFENSQQLLFDNNKWEKKELGKIADFKNGMNYTKSSKGQTIEIVGVKNFKDNFYVPSKKLENVVIDGKMNESYLMKKGDIISVRSNGNPNLIGRTLLAKEVNGSVSHSGFTIRIRLNPDTLSPVFLCYYLKTAKTRKELVDSGNGVGIRSLNQGALSSLLVPYPKTALEQKIVVERLERLSVQTKKLQSLYTQKISDLEELKKSILQKAFTGQLTTN